MNQRSAPRKHVPNDMLEKWVAGEPQACTLAIEKHVARCEVCAETVHELQNASPLIAAARRPLGTDPESEGLVTRLVDRVTKTRQPKRDEPSPQGLNAPEFGFLKRGPADRPGSRRLGKFRIDAVLARGGMGVLFRAHDSFLKREVALKIILPQHLQNREMRSRFLGEARALAAIEDDNVVSVREVGVAENVPFLVMPLLQGETLRGRLNRETRLSVSDACSIGIEIALGLQAAHQKGFIHRDITPSNVFLERLPDRFRVKLLDFGLTRPLASRRQVTEPGMAAGGTPGYAPLEQVLGQTVSERTDLFSLGVVLYEMLNGVKPFADLAGVVAGQTPKPLATLHPHVPTALSDLVTQLLKQQSDERPACAAEVVARLRGCLAAATPELSESPDSRSVTTEVIEELRFVDPSARTRPRIGSRTLLISAVCLMFVVAGAVAWTVWLSRSGAPTSKAVVAVVDPTKAETPPTKPKSEPPTPEIARQMVARHGGKLEPAEGPPERVFLMNKNNLTNKDVSLLLAFPSLISADFANSPGVGDAALETLKSLPQLKSLGLSETGVTDAGITHLLEMPKLRDVDLIRAARVSPAAIERLKRKGISVKTED